MADHKGTAVEKRTVILCVSCDQWKMGGVESRLCDKCWKPPTLDWTKIWDKWGFP